jgi:hypothetical protein
MRHGAVIAVTNILTLLAGVIIGLSLPHLSRVFAQPVPLTPPTVAIEEVIPVMTAGAVAFGTVLAGRIAADDISVRGLDLLKLHQNTLNLMSSKPGLFTPAEVQGVIEQSRSPVILRMKGPVGPAPPGEKK